MPTKEELKRDVAAERAYLLGIMTFGLGCLRRLDEFELRPTPEHGKFEFTSPFSGRRYRAVLDEVIESPR
jgi:hypothetical protein